jgi:putative tricarboxylic transport membrane protein
MYTVNNSVFDIWMMLLFGAMGFLMRKWAYEGAPLLLALVLGPKLEVAFRQALMISHGDFGVFIDRPVSMVFLLATIVFLLLPIFQIFFKKSKKRGGVEVQSSRFKV